MADHIHQALTDAATRAQTKPLPQSAPARMRALVRAAGSAPAAAAALGISPRTVQRYLRGEIKNPRPALAATLETELRRRWQPLVQRRALKAARTAGVRFAIRARFGYTAAGGSTDEARMRRFTGRLDPHDAARLIDAHLQGASEDTLRALLAEGLGHAYFRDGGRRARSLDVEVTGIDYLELRL
ncbi:hypothetical protein BV881_33250 [Streptomyces sp. ZL-24]|uniref:telomere-protecting terminal protein Tpg n=1 Tax=Streptomyces sp. ZL-24 TaxID=1933029 RepID=UPI000CD3C4F8|nr:DNA-binding protein [Streptomyces sp. ZL-24]POG43194.1 hypothetical protein BV881_33250 [Streptomyces sp. ZL-24]